MKYRIVLRTQSKKGHDVTLKLKVPPSKHQGLSNFLKIALDPANNNSDVKFTIEKIDEETQNESSLFGKFKFQKMDEEN